MDQFQATFNPLLDYNAGPIADLPSSTAASYAPLPSTGQNTTKCQLMQAVPPRLVNRSNPQVNVGAVDLSCAVVVVDARRYDLPMYIYASIRKAGRLLDSGSWWMNLLLSSSASQASGDWISEKQPFVNLLTIISISRTSEKIDYSVGILADPVEQPNAIIRNMEDGTYMTNYQNVVMPSSMSSS
ncbi:hypothetical protein VTP01DRAFT_3233 [Rhizomucor pusillus]|uniref:uncharacterized protein n=1 Tax=Rhizomucor pusillus TaxID=4840 RepID=UPI003743E091